jgi:hypothetical protein
MNLFEKLGAKAARKVIMLKFPFLKRWLPLIGTAIVAGSVVARALGFTEVSDLLDLVGSLTGASAQSLIGVAAVASLVGVVLKLISEARKALGKGDEFVKPR